VAVGPRGALCTRSRGSGMSMLARSALDAELRRTAFGSPVGNSLIPRRIGAEVEFIPVDSLTGRRCPIEAEGVSSTLPFLRRFGLRQGWRESCTSKGTPCFSLPVGGTLTFEPGGQLEYSSPPCRSASALLALLRSVVAPLRAAAAGEGIELLSLGIDPFNPIERAPLLVHAERYDRMAAYLERRGPAGARMMRQTAAFQVSLDFDDEPWLRWRVLNAAAPYVVAIFANSPIYAGAPVGYQSARAEVWRTLDPLRTGIPYDARDPVAAYLDFALAAPAILYPTVGGEHLPFGEWLARAHPSETEWQDHLSTLFPEVRPRGHLELRSSDSVAPHWYAAPIALATGILYHPGALRASADLLGTPDLGLLERAGRAGLHDPAIARTAVDLFEVALQGCQCLGPRYFHPADLDQAAAYFERYTRRGRSPADDVLESAIAA
jgi:glutamate--cysteine ligase